MKDIAAKKRKRTTKFLFDDFITHSYGQWKLMAADNNDASISTYGLRLFPYVSYLLVPFPEYTIIFIVIYIIFHFVCLLRWQFYQQIIERENTHTRHDSTGKLLKNALALSFDRDTRSLMLIPIHRLVVNFFFRLLHHQIQWIKIPWWVYSFHFYKITRLASFRAIKSRMLL